MRITKCPVCEDVFKTNLDIAIHLMQTHEWAYRRAMDYLREKAEVCEIL